MWAWELLNSIREQALRKVMKVSTLLITSIFSLIITISPAQATPENPKATLVVLLDISDTMMNNHIQKISRLSSIVDEVLQNKVCDFQVSVGNISYKGLQKPFPYNLKFIGNPPVVDQNTPNGIDLIRNRIFDPAAASMGETGESLRRNGVEITYSSIANSISYNKKLLTDSDAVGAILVTDGVPGFEVFSPQEAYQKIIDTLGTRTLFTSAIVAPELSQDMLIPSNQDSCPIDYTIKQTPGQPFSLRSYDSQNMNAINEFTQIVGGMQWNICDESYERQLKIFIYTLLSLAGCQPIA